MKKIPYLFRDLLIQTIQSSRSKLPMWEKITIWLWGVRTIFSAETLMPPRTLPSSTPLWDAANWHKSMCASGWTTSSPTSTTMTRTTHVICWNSFRTISSRRVSSDILWEYPPRILENPTRFWKYLQFLEGALHCRRYFERALKHDKERAEYGMVVFRSISVHYSGAAVCGQKG